MPVARPFVARQAPLQRSGHAALPVFGRGIAQHHHGHAGLAPALVGAAHHGALRHPGVLGQQLLDLGRVDVLPAGDDHVLGAAHHGVAAVGVLARQVAAVEEAFGVERGDVGPIQPHHVRAAHADLAHAAPRHGLAVGAGEANLDARRGPAAGAHVLHGLGRAQGDGERPGFRAAINVAHRDAARMAGAQQIGRQQAGAGPDGAQAAQVGPCPARVLLQRLQRGGHLQRERGERLGQGVEHGARVETAVQQHRGAARERRQRLDAQPAHVEQRQHREHRVLLGDLLHLRGDGHVGQQVGLGVHRALGLARGARRVDQQHRVVGAARMVREAFRRLGGQLVADVQRVHGQGRDPVRGGQRARRFGEGLVVHQQHRRTVVEHTGPLGGGQSVVQRHQHGAAVRQSEQQGDLRGVVEAQPGHAQPALHRQGLRQGPGAQGQRGVVQ